MTYFIGTSGYSYKHWWNNVFYPQDLKPQNWLEYYCKFFKTVELNNTFYRLPQASAFQSWYKRVPDDFAYAVKGSRFITHIKRLKGVRESLKLFIGRAVYLKSKLSVLLWQLPPRFRCNKKRLAQFCRHLRPYRKYRHVFEFRDESWFCKDTYALMEREGHAICRADWPPFYKKLEKTIPITAPFVYIRRHGQGNLPYRSCYPRSYLRQLSLLVKRCSRKRLDVYVYFNNDANGYAVSNAQALAEYL